MKVLIVGSGAREHALAWRLKQSPRLTGLWVADGNAGTASIATNLPVKPDDVDGIVETARSLGIDLVVVGPEQPLALGVVDRLSALGIPAFGPTKAASQLEASKGFALEVMREAGVPCPEFQVFREQMEALDYLESHSGPVVVKADGLAAGKGVSLCATADEAAAAVRACMGGRIFGTAGETVVIQEMLTGPEVSVFAFSDGEHLSSLAAACDYKRLGDGNQGPNTGGMGSFTPPDFWNDEMAGEIVRTVMRPVVETMSQRGAPYKGVLYAGIMLTAAGPKVLEFNCRFGDPETQVMLPQLATDPLEVMSACVEGRLDRVPVTWETNCYVGVVLASGGYPAHYETGFEIDGLDGVDRNTMIFHAATRQAPDGAPGRLVTSGGRVLTVVGRGGSLAEARARAYDRVREIHFQGAQYRTDIAALEQKGRAWTPGQTAPGG
jgi:phosphoribosylamine--glycine ligase